MGASTLTSRKGSRSTDSAARRYALQWGLDADVEEGVLHCTAGALHLRLLQWGLDADVEEGEAPSKPLRNSSKSFNGASTLTSRKGGFVRASTAFD